MVLLAIQIMLFAIWATILIANRGMEEERIRRSAMARGWTVVSITNESDPVLPVSKYRVVYTSGDPAHWHTTFCNPSVFGVLWFDSGFLLPLLP